MKKSEELKKQASQEENDFRAMSLYNKSLRETRFEKFHELDIQGQLERKGCIVVPFNGSKVVIDTQTEKWGVIDYFPKANRILVRKGNNWHSAGLRWIIINLLQNG